MLEAQKAATHDEPREALDMLEVYCFLACLGPQWLEKENAAKKVHFSQDGAVLDLLLEPSNRQAVSKVLATLFARSLHAKGREGAWCLVSLLPALVDADVFAGFSVLSNLASGLGPTLAEELANTVLSMIVAENDGIGRGRRPAREANRRIRYLVSILTQLDLSRESRTKLFLALSQILQDDTALRSVVLSPLFPAKPEDGREVLIFGSEKAVRLFIRGAILRPHGKSEFYNLCKVTADLELAQGLDIFGKVYALLDMSDGGERGLAAIVRGWLLLALENQARDGQLLRVLPPTVQPRSLSLLAIVAAGLKEPMRTQLCNYLIETAGSCLSSLNFLPDEWEYLAQVLITAVVLHFEPARAGARVRQILLDTAGALRVRSILNAAQNLRVAFSALVQNLHTEFRRRERLACCLEPVLPFLREFEFSSIDHTALALSE